MIEDTTVGYSIIPLLMLLTSLVPGLIIFTLPEPAVRTRTVLNMTGAILKVAFVIALIPPVIQGTLLQWRAPLVPGVDLLLSTDPLAMLFVGLSAPLWLATTIYAIGYLEKAPNRSRFFGFFSLCVTATTGIALSGNLLTFLLFYEMLTLVTYPLVAHRGTGQSLRSARTYLIYTLSGGGLLLFGVAWLTYVVGPLEFDAGGIDAVGRLAAEDPVTATTIFVLLIAGVGVKAAIFPLHGWLPQAMVAPAPVSALLHAVAVVKAGAFGIIRVVHDVYGIGVARDLGVLGPLAALAAFTIIYGSLQAITKDGLKQRLAYSTISQVSYIVLGAAMFGIAATTGAIVHIVHQGLMKITLFFCAGLFAETLELHKVSELGGVGRRMPLTATCFTIGAFGMIGLPPVAGFVSKWQLGIGALEADQDRVIAVLMTSTLLNAVYFLPIVYTLWFVKPKPDAHWHTPVYRQRNRIEAPGALLWPTVAVAALAVIAGLIAGFPYSPLSIAELIGDDGYPGR